MVTYLALLRGVNVGGQALIKMSDLRASLTAAGFGNVHTYIQSGNVFFDSTRHDTEALARQIEQVIETHFHIASSVAVFNKASWTTVIASAPRWWGKDASWKHNLLILIPPYDMTVIIASIGTLKPDIEAMEPGNGVLYQSMSRTLFGRTTTGKLASSPVYKHMTVRNYNTATKLLVLF